MAKARHGYVLAIDAAVLAAGARRHREGDESFYGLQLATLMRVEKIVVYRSLRRLTQLGLVERWWEDQDIASASGRPRRRLYALNQHGLDALPHAIAGRRVFGRTSPRDSNSVRRGQRPPVRLRRRPWRGRRR